MKKVYFIKTDGYYMLVSVDENNNCRYLTETNEFPYITTETEEHKVKVFLESVEDDSSWENDCSYEQLFEAFPIEIIAEIEKEL